MERKFPNSLQVWSSTREGMKQRALQCKECIFIYSPTQFGNKHTLGFQYYLKQQPVVEVTDTVYFERNQVAGMAVLSGISIQTKADKDPGLVYACLVYQRASDCQEYLALTRQLAYHISHLLWLFYNRTVGIKCRFCMLKQIHVNLRNRISSPRLEPHNESTFLKSTSNAPNLPLVACSETRLSQKWSSTVWSSLCLPVLVV